MLKHKAFLDQTVLGPFCPIRKQVPNHLQRLGIPLPQRADVSDEELFAAASGSGAGAFHYLSGVSRPEHLRADKAPEEVGIL